MENPMKMKRWFLVLSVAVALTGAAQAGDSERKAAKDLSSFGTLRTLTPDVAKAQALDWLKAVKSDEQSLKTFESIWKDADRMVLDQVADTLALGDCDAAKLLAEARDATALAPTKV